MALVTTMSGVIGVLAAMALFLWFSAYIEYRHLGPLAGPEATAAKADRLDQVPADEPVPMTVVADPLTSAA